MPGPMFGVGDPDAETAVATYVKLLRAARSVVAGVEPRIHASGLTMTQFGVLEAILHRGALTQRDLGRKVLTSAANMTDVIDKLSQRGLVIRVRCPKDRRQVRVELTQPGRDLVAALFPHHAADIAAGMAGLAPAELEALGDLLRRLGMAAARGPANGDLAKSCPGDDLSAR